MFETYLLGLDHPSETDSDSFVDVCHAVSTLQEDPDPILAPMIESAKADTDYQMMIQVLGKFKNPKSLPFTYPGCQLNSVWTQLDKDLAYLGRFKGPQAIWLSSDQPKTLMGTLFSNGVLSQPLGMPKRVTNDASLEGP